MFFVYGNYTTSYSYIYTNLGTHDIQTASISEIASGEVEASISFTPGSLARGALLIIHGGVGTGKSSLLLPFGRDMTINYTLSIGLTTGQFKTFWYDIEGDGTLTNGVNYPAVTGELTKMSTGMLIGYHSVILFYIPYCHFY